MRKNKELFRAKNLIKNDRISIDDGFDVVLKSDLKHFLDDFFDIKKEIMFNIVEVDGKYNFEIKFEFDNIKSFKTIV